MRIRLLNTQSGMVLLLCLMFLTALTLLGLSASADTVLQNQLSTNLQDTERAKQAAQTTLRWAENWLNELEGPAPDTCTAACTGFTVHPAAGLVQNPEYQDLAWWQTNGYEAGIDPLTGEFLATVGTANIDPLMWVIEASHEALVTGDNGTVQKVWYRLLARGNGRSDTSVSVIESIFIKHWLAAGSTETAVNERVSWRELR